MHPTTDLEYYVNISGQSKKLVLLIAISEMSSRVWCLRFEIKERMLRLKSMRLQKLEKCYLCNY